MAREQAHFCRTIIMSHILICHPFGVLMVNICLVGVDWFMPQAQQLLAKDKAAK
jgi:ABC-type spermidine/putrescine transport system permease subunit II